ncbi:hypothetical protein L915_07304 [Phytophthora nicotianae]|uniref:Uncharacterized protein n=4 Tax=Phytophthora nicotianae TaxID=4792 RepID=W2QB20_PHYN3|nr:hypothetical protein PPTG_10488 [Phytophthora nicotianae INRA-310]ETI48500.1 hypothetical protein F443_07473 [Phytophthora nicotianae P1569]ETK88436.1 hypothetical protein L915_07304 [Phytophthora nicotianae]ETO77283.1 hypothetical protein F444_07491 [Phytophthora nicotianae P1976]ETM48231.1 hypothetical protein L914_07197 [Phytophthora nicotianae]ETN10342.1 hypothetical protein PPTG_10488 [Phytophthora nicotianae INRA-310]
MQVIRRGVRVAVRLRRPPHLTSSASSSLHHFSSSSDAKPSVLDGPDGVLQFANRAMERVTQMERYREHSVFPPSNWMLHNYLLFTKLQLPTNTEIDAVDFLNGARFACDLAVNTMYSTEFVNFATGAISESPAAEKMKSGLSETCYDAFLFAMKQTSKTGNRFTLKQLDINGVYLYDVHWDRMSLAELKQEEALEAYNRAQVAELEEDKGDKVEEKEKVVVNPMENISPEDHTVMIERLRLDVQLDAVEHLEVVTTEAEDQVFEKNSSAVWRFESLVTQPDDVDWRIVSVL